MRVFRTIHEAYLQILRDVVDYPDYQCAPRGQAIREILDYQFRITEPVAEPIVTRDQDRNLVIAKYTAEETALYDSGSNKAADFAKASKFWNQIANPDGTLNSSYGYLIWKNHSLGTPQYEMKVNGSDRLDDDSSWCSAKEECYRTPWQWCVESLKADKDTRQALLRFSLPEHHWVGNKDFVCTISGNFLIRDDKLHFSVVMRSNDIVKGACYDLPWFISLMQKMVDELKPTYPDLKVGHYTHLAHSMHMYEKDINVVQKMLGNQKEN